MRSHLTFGHDHGEDTGEGYLATVSDLVAGLVFVFILMLAFFAYQLAERTEAWEGQGATRRQILEDIAERLRGQGLRVDVLLDQGVLRLSENAVNFPSGDELPVPEHERNVGHLAEAIAEVIPCYLSDRGSWAVRAEVSDAPYCALPANPGRYSCEKDRFPWLLETLLIEGHTDDTPVRPGRRFRDNLELSSMRAATVHRMITACEPRMESLLNTHGFPVLSTSGYGEQRPITTEADAKHENRRIDLRFLLEPPEGALGRPIAPVGSDLEDRLRERRR